VQVEGIDNKLVYWGYLADETGGDPIAKYKLRFGGSGENFLNILANSVGSVVVIARSQVYGDKTDTARINIDPPPADGQILFQFISTGERRTCGLSREGVTYCWGANLGGILGVSAISMCGEGYQHDDYPCNPLPAKVDNSPRFATLAVGDRHTCGLTVEGSVYCWGENVYGQVGNGSSVTARSPLAVPMPERVVSLSAAGARTCAATETGRVFCWGAVSPTTVLDPAFAPLCFSNGGCTAAPTPIEGSPTIRQISVSSAHICGLTADSTAYCWGDNSFGELGTGDYSNRKEPTPVNSAARFSSIAAGPANTCALATTGETYCWGLLGAPTASCDKVIQYCSPVPRVVDTQLRFKQLAPKTYGVCGIATDDEVYCWGSLVLLGSRSGGSISTPTKIARPGPFEFIAYGTRTCEIAKTGLAYCWGNSDAGESGTGQLSFIATPLAVEGPLQMP
jgi:alpha-tubulin suppressor-like RCC1 family protein